MREKPDFFDLPEPGKHVHGETTEPKEDNPIGDEAVLLVCVAALGVTAAAGTAAYFLWKKKL